MSILPKGKTYPPESGLKAIAWVLFPIIGILLATTTAVLVFLIIEAVK